MMSEAEFGAILRDGAGLWNEHRFFECHDKLEEAWKGVKQEKKSQPARDPRRDFTQGLILLAVAYHHWSKRNPVGALRKLREAEHLLDAYPSRFQGLDAPGLLRAVRDHFARLRADEAAELDLAGVPRLIVER